MVASAVVGRRVASALQLTSALESSSLLPWKSGTYPGLPFLPYPLSPAWHPCASFAFCTPVEREVALEALGDLSIDSSSRRGRG